MVGYLFQLDEGGRGLFLPQLSVPGFADSPWYLTFSEECMGLSRVDRWMWVGSRRKGGRGYCSWYAKWKKIKIVKSFMAVWGKKIFFSYFSFPTSKSLSQGNWLFYNLIIHHPWTSTTLEKNIPYPWWRNFIEILFLKKSRNSNHVVHCYGYFMVTLR